MLQQAGIFYSQSLLSTLEVALVLLEERLEPSSVGFSEQRVAPLRLLFFNIPVRAALLVFAVVKSRTPPVRRTGCWEMFDGEIPASQACRAPVGDLRGHDPEGAADVAAGAPPLLRLS